MPKFKSNLKAYFNYCEVVSSLKKKKKRSYTTDWNLMKYFLFNKVKKKKICLGKNVRLLLNPNPLLGISRIKKSPTYSVAGEDTHHIVLVLPSICLWEC